MNSEDAEYPTMADCCHCCVETVLGGVDNCWIVIETHVRVVSLIEAHRKL